MITTPDPESDPDPELDPALEQEQLPLPGMLVLPELEPILDPELVPQLLLPELAAVPLPEPDAAVMLSDMARAADELALFVAEHAAREADPSHWAELLAGIAERDAELARWAAGAP